MRSKKLALTSAITLGLIFPGGLALAQSGSAAESAPSCNDGYRDQPCFGTRPPADASEIWTQHRQFPSYTSLENDSQFGLDAATAGANPDWTKADELIKALNSRMESIIINASNGPELSPIFEHLYHVRKARAYLNVARDLVTIDQNFTKAADHIDDFAARFDAEAQGDVAFRNGDVAASINNLLSTLPAFLRNPANSAADKTAKFNTFSARVGQGVNLINAAARGAAPPAQRVKPILECVPNSGKDWLNFSYLKAIQVAASAATFGGSTANLGTEPGSQFDKLVPALDARFRFILTSKDLRTALRSLTDAITAPGGSQAAVDTAKASVNDQLDLARQTLWGEFWQTSRLNSCNPGAGALGPA